MDYNFETGTPNSRNPPVSANRIRRVANLEHKHIRPACLSHPPRGELELKTYSREYFTQPTSKMLSIPMVCFIDGFGLYRNMYRTLMCVYLTLASMNSRQRSRGASMFSLTLGPHASSFADVISGVSGLKDLDKGVELEVEGETRNICAYISNFIGDMPAQNTASGIKSQNATMGCRSCLIDELHRGDLNWDVILKGRYH
ncbi:hypothetical protein L207DRAFT_531721 [Hyaloscypha variabilis F]|uniref:Uncharacterized protein n=1 Tax=Hyaloscypha variabilis (strain UAMH 11265 / GT02V1 / F) TaxID=1149755 RepID=A0A2J6RFZ1_HYAVF|nr:hypothetical protein L207DRAFT_531721 [Hyaloscypha variabilis F]